MEPTETLQSLTLPLLQWYQENARKLPWRGDPEPYRVWVSEIMLQQTRVVAVIDYFNRFMAALPDVAALADCSEDELNKLWQGLGYYSRARNLQKAAKYIMSTYGGTFPSDYDQIRALPGIGDYTAGAVASIAFGTAVPAVDGNVLRVVVRILGDDREITRPETKRAVRSLLQEVIPRRAPGDFNQALMELGATICLPHGVPLCENCPAMALCAAFRDNRIDELPVRAPKRERRVEERTVWLLFHGGKVALRRRPERGLLAGLWEYPNESSDGEDWLNLWHIELTGEKSFLRGKHLFTHIEWDMVAVSAATLSESLPEGWVWASLRDLEQKYAVPSAFRFVQKEVRARLRQGEMLL